MACHFPRPVWKAKCVNPESGKRPFAFRPSEGFTDLPGSVPCGQCLGCRLDWAGDWAARCEKESKLYDRNCFVTLTYNEENLPLGASTRSSVSKRDWQLFMKRLRKANPDHEIRFFATGEYGDKNQRAHYHALLFNHDFPDKRLWKPSPRTPLYLSPQLDELWGHGFTSVGSVSFASASYVARYVVKKLTGDRSDYVDRDSPFVLMSRRPGIGAAWYDKFKSDIYPSGQLIVGEGKLRNTPRFFDNKLQAEDPEAYRLLKATRRAKAKLNPTTPRQLINKHITSINKLQNTPRPL